jgi:hypothetical protein
LPEPISAILLRAMLSPIVKFLSKAGAGP